MTSKKQEHTLCSLLFTTTPDYSSNLKTLLTLVYDAKEKSVIVASEVCLTGFDYEHLERALNFAEVATEEIKKASLNKIIILTMLEKRDGKVFNIAKIFFNGEVVYERAKARLFRFGNEHLFMSEGKDEDFKIVEVDGIKIALLICFELRFKELWQQSEGADIIAVPSWWGVLRSEHLRAITQTLAIINQCYVIVSDANNEECSKMSGIITPQGEESRNGNKPCLVIPYKKKEIRLMRRYMDVGLG